MKKRAFLLLGFVLFFVGVVLALPSSPGMKPSRLARNLPESFTNWRGKPQEPGSQEKKILARDTEFERMHYVDTVTRLPSVEASIVFSGKNLSQSIHRPEVCLRAQGWNFVSESYEVWPDLLPNGELLPVKELICRMVYRRTNEAGDPEDVLREDGSPVYIWRAFYYTFFGHERVVAGHYERTGEDMKDRLLKGHDQRWAYATFSSFITKKHEEQRLNQGAVDILDEAETKTHIQSFLKELLPLVVSAPGEGVDLDLMSENDSGE